MLPRYREALRYLNTTADNSDDAAQMALAILLREVNRHENDEIDIGEYHYTRDILKELLTYMSKMTITEDN